MKQTIAAWSLAATALLAPTAATTDTLYDDFKTKWGPIQRGTGTKLNMVRNRLEISLDAGAQSDSDFFGSGLVSTCELGGNFDLRVTFRLLNWPAHNGVRVALYLGAPAGIENEGVYLERDSYSEADVVGGDPFDLYVFYAGEGLTYVEQPTADMSGRFRVQRIGSVVTGYYWSDPDWIALGSSNVETQDLPFALIAYSHDSVFADTDVRAAFDTVRLATGSFTGAACPFAN
jgi:hypothetical protein